MICDGTYIFAKKAKEKIFVGKFYSCDSFLNLDPFFNSDLVFKRENERRNLLIFKAVLESISSKELIELFEKSSNLRVFKSYYKGEECEDEYALRLIKIKQFAQKFLNDVFIIKDRNKYSKYEFMNNKF